MSQAEIGLPKETTMSMAAYVRFTDGAERAWHTRMEPKFRGGKSQCAQDQAAKVFVCGK